MLVSWKGKFVFLAAPKSASTSIEQAFLPHSQLVLRAHPAFRHTRYDQFQRFLQPFLTAKGLPRDSYEVVCVCREPIDWLASWWRYRSRADLADPEHHAHHNYAGHLSFEQFARAYMKGEKQLAQLIRLSRFVRPRPGQPEVDRVFRYDRLDLLVDYLCERVGEEVKVGIENVSPERSFSLPEGCERELREFFAPEYHIYEEAISE